MRFITLCLLAAMAVLWMAASLVSPFARRANNDRLPSMAVGLGALSLLGAPIAGVPFHSVDFALPPPFFLGMAGFDLRLDGLAAWFLGVIAIVTVPVAAYVPAYMDHVRQRVDMRLFHASLP